MASHPPNEVHVWCIELDCEPAVFSAFEAVLSPQERQRAERFAFDELRRRWTAAHGALRMILADYAEAAPQDIAFEAGPQGKPRLAANSSSIDFSLSHTGPLAFVAIASACVGIDAEVVRPEIAYQELSRHFFAPAEVEEIEALAEAQRVDAFFACWTRKEAFVKALGIGLFMALDRFQVTVRPDAPARLVWVEGGVELPGQWSLSDLGESGVAAAVAVRQPSANVRRFAFKPPGT